jgi:glycosyltransferase involved in cell wall biosynthesis
MRVALVHSFYSSMQPSGENAVVRSEYEALAAAGVDVQLVRADTDELEAVDGYKLRSAVRVASGWGRDPLDELDAIRPDVIHVHNTFPNWGDRWVGQVAAPVVHTLHNFRPLCAAGTLYRDGAICTLCADGATRHAVRHACYRGSRVASLPLAIRNHGGPANNRLLRGADRLITLSARMRDIYVGGGADPTRTLVWPNFLQSTLDPGARIPRKRGDRFLFVGRLSEEKGPARLAEQWPVGGPPLDIIGDGPQRVRVAAAAAANPAITVHGTQERARVIAVMSEARALVMPSVCYEGFPLTYAEALACGLPVLTFEPCNVVEFVREDGTGSVLRWDASIGDQLPGSAVLAQWSERCRPVFEARYTEAAYLRRATSLYEELL